MTCVIGMVDNGRVWMGADSQGTDAWHRATQHRTAKVFQRGPLVIGFTSSYRFGQVLRYAPDLPEPKDFGERYMVTAFVPWLRKALADGGWVQKHDEREMGGTALIGGFGLLFKLQDDFSVLESNRGIDATGAGMETALGAMLALRSAPEKRIRRALTISAELSSVVGGSFEILHDGGSREKV